MDSLHTRVHRGESKFNALVASRRACEREKPAGLLLVVVGARCRLHCGRITATSLFACTCMDDGRERSGMCSGAERRGAATLLCIMRRMAQRLKNPPLYISEAYGRPGCSVPVPVPVPVAAVVINSHSHSPSCQGNVKSVFARRMAVSSTT